MSRAARRAEARSGNLAGVAHPTPLMRRMAIARHGPQGVATIDSMIEDAVAVNAMADLMGRALDATANKDGKADLKEAAMFVIKEMRRNQK